MPDVLDQTDVSLPRGLTLIGGDKPSKATAAPDDGFTLPKGLRLIGQPEQASTTTQPAPKQSITPHGLSMVETGENLKTGLPHKYDDFTFEEPHRPVTRPQPPEEPTEFMAIGNPKGMIRSGNLPIWNRPSVQNADGSHSTEYSTSFTDERPNSPNYGKEVLIPTVINGRFATPDGKKPSEGSKEEKEMFRNAWDHYLKTGQNLGVFDDAKNADTYANVLHNRGIKPSSLYPSVGVIRQGKPEMFMQKLEDRFSRTETGRTVENNLDQFSRMFKSLATANFGGLSTKELQDHQERLSNFIDMAVPIAMRENPYTAGLAESNIATKFVSGATKAGAIFTEDMLTPSQVALIAATGGENVATKLAVTAGTGWAVPAIKTVSELASLQFKAQMVEGAYIGATSAMKSAVNGDLEGTVQNATDALISGMMARGMISHDIATERVKGDLDRTSNETYGLKFGQLNTFQQGAVIDSTVKSSPEYQETLKAAQDQKEEAKDQAKRQRQKKLADYYGRALNQAWNPDAAARAIGDLHNTAEENEAKLRWNNLLEQIRIANEKNEQVKAQARKEAIEDIDNGRKKTAEHRQQREMESEVDTSEGETVPSAVENGNLFYPVNVYGQEGKIGVDTSISGYRVYYQEPNSQRGYLANNGNFDRDEENATDIVDPNIADTLARITALRTEARNRAINDDAEAAAKADHLTSIQQQLMNGEVSPSYAESLAGIKGKERIPDEYDAGVHGDITGPYQDGKAKFFNDYVENRKGDPNVTEGQINTELANLEAQAWADTRSNLNHVQRSGDYIVDRSGQRWELGSDGLLHGPNGRTIPLLENGIYSNQAMHMAAYGRLGYGAESREQRIEREQQQQAVNRGVAFIDQSLIPSEEKAARTEKWIRRQQVPPDFIRPEQEEGRQGPEPKTDEALMALLLHISDPEWTSHPEAAMSIVEDEAHRLGIPAEKLVKQKLSLDDSPAGRIARLQPGDEIKEGRRTWLVKADAKGNLYIQSGGARIDLNAANINRWILGKKVITGDEIVFKHPVTEEMAQRTAYETPFASWGKQQIDEIQARHEGKSEDPPARNEEEANQQVAAAEIRQDVAMGAAIKDAIGATDVTSKTTESEIDKGVEKAKKSLETAKIAAAQTARKVGKAKGRGNFEQRAPIPVERTGNEVIITQGDESHPAHYALVNIRGITLSHYWDGNQLRKNPAYVPDGMQKRTFDEQAIADLMRESSPEEFRPADYLQDYNDPERGTAILEQGGRAVGGNTRLLRILRYLENLKRQGEDGEVALAMFHDGIRNFARRVGIENYPEGIGDNYIVVRILDKPIETNAAAISLGELFNSKTSREVSDGIQAVTHGKYLKEADSRESLNGEEGILTQIAKALAGEHLATVRAAIDEKPVWFAQIVKEYLHISDSETAKWFENSNKGPVLTDDGKKKFELALIATHIPNVEAVSRIANTRPAIALGNSIGTITALRAYPDRDLTGKISDAVNSLLLTARFREDGEKPGAAWNHTYANGGLAGFGFDAPPEPDMVVRAIYQALLDPKTRRLNTALKDLIAGQQPEMGVLFAPEVNGKQLLAPVDYFNAAFAPELKEIARQQGEKPRELTQTDFDAALNNQATQKQQKEVIGEHKQPEQEGGGETVPAPPPLKSPSKLMERPPQAPIVTVAGLKEFLTKHAGTRADASDGLRTAAMIAKYVYDLDSAEEKTPQQALQWMLENRFLGLEDTGLSAKEAGARGEWVEKQGWAKGILRLHQAADITTFIHEFCHAVFPMLDEDSLRAINSMDGPGPKWDGTREGLRDEKVWKALNEKLAYGVEKTLKNREHVGFDEGQRKVLARIREVFRKLYTDQRNDPLSSLKMTKASQRFFDEIFGFDPDVDARAEREAKIRKAEGRQKRLTRPEEEPHWITRLADDVGLANSGGEIKTGLRNVAGGDIVDKIGKEPISLRKPISEFSFPSQQAALDALVAMENRMSERRVGVPKGAELVDHRDGTWGIRFNGNLPDTVLHQELRQNDDDIEREKLKRELNSIPTWQKARRMLIETKLANVENRIRSRAGVEQPATQPMEEVTQKAYEEAKNARADSRRAATHGVSGIQESKRIEPVPKRALLGMPRHAITTTPEGTGRTGLREANKVFIEPLRGERGHPVGRTGNDTFDQKKWDEQNRKDGLPELPAPTWPLEPTTAAMLDLPGQASTAQTLLSAIQQGDGALAANATGSGKTRVAMAIVKEFNKNGDKLILYISKNRSLLEKTRKVGRDLFAVGISLDAPEMGKKAGTYGVSYQKALRNPIYQNIPWDLVIADESGEARNWFEDTRDKNGKPRMNQGQMLKAIMERSKKGIYMSATPFHSPMEYGYLDKLNLWPKGKFDDWLKRNFVTYEDNGVLTARLDPIKQMNLRAQLVERGQMVSQAISYDGFHAHFGVVPVTSQMMTGIDRISVGFDRAKDYYARKGNPAMAKMVSAYEATFLKNYMERQTLPQAIDIAKQAIGKGYQVIIASEQTGEDLFHRERNGELSAYQQLDDEMDGQLKKILPSLPDVYSSLKSEFGDAIGDYSGTRNTLSEREAAREAFMAGDKPMLYTTMAAGGIGIDLHDTEGDKPRVMIILGPPYSGVLLEQVMGRPWRFGVKSDVHLVVLATDAAPNINLIHTKVAPRMRALRASVLGENDSLSDVMQSYGGQDRKRLRDDMLAYAEGDEMKLNAADYKVQSKSRDVGVSDWSSIRFPSAEDAKNKGMKYGNLEGGNWTALYQAKFEPMKVPDTPGQKNGKDAIDAMAKSISESDLSVSSVQELEPNQRQAAIGGAAAQSAVEVGLSADRDGEAVAAQSMKRSLNIPRDIQVNFEEHRNWWGKKTKRAIWKFPEGTVPIFRSEVEEEPADIATTYWGAGSMKGGMESIARQAGVPEIGLELTRTISEQQRDQDMIEGQLRWYARKIFEENKLDRNDKAIVSEVMDAMRGKTASTNPAVNKVAAEMRDWFDMVRDAVMDAGVKTKDKRGNWVKWIPRKDYDWHHIIDWNGEVEYQNPETGKVERHRLKDVMQPTFAEAKRNEIMARLAARATNPDGSPVSPEAMTRYLAQKYKRGTPIQAFQQERSIDFPIIRRDFGVIENYAHQIAKSISVEKSFGSDRGKINTKISKIPSANGRRDINAMFDALFSPQELSGKMLPARILGVPISEKLRGSWNQFSNALTTFTALSKMPLSFAKVPFHGAHMIYALHGDIRPMVRGMAELTLHSKANYDEAVMLGTLARQVDFTGITDEGQRPGLQHLMFDITGFNSAYSVARVWANVSGRVWMEQYAMNGLKKGGRAAEETRRILRQTMLVNDEDITRAVSNGHFNPEDIKKAQVAFANEVMFTDNPTEMPGWARKAITSETPGWEANLFRAMRLTYSMASFTVKTRAFLRKYIMDETFRYGNPKMLALAAVAEPILGALVATTGSAIRAGIQRSAEAVSGQPHKQNALNREKDLIEGALHSDLGVKGITQKAALYVDWLTYGIAQEQVKLLGDMLLNITANPKKALKEAEYYGSDLLEGVIGPIWETTVVHPMKWGIDEVEILARGKEVKKRSEHRAAKAVFEEFPITQNLPAVKRMEAPPPKQKNNYYR